MPRAQYSSSFASSVAMTLSSHPVRTAALAILSQLRAGNRRTTARRPRCVARTGSGHGLFAANLSGVEPADGRRESPVIGRGDDAVGRRACGGRRPTHSAVSVGRVVRGDDYFYRVSKLAGSRWKLGRRAGRVAWGSTGRCQMWRVSGSPVVAGFPSKARGGAGPRSRRLARYHPSHALASHVFPDRRSLRPLNGTLAPAAVPDAKSGAARSLIRCWDDPSAGTVRQPTSPDRPKPRQALGNPRGESADIYLPNCCFQTPDISLAR